MQTPFNRLEKDSKYNVCLKVEHLCGSFGDIGNGDQRGQIAPKAEADNIKDGKKGSNS